MSTAPETLVELGDRYFRELPELGLRWRAAVPPDPRLLVLNEPLARELGLDPDWLRSPDGVRLLVGNLVPTGATPVAQAYAGHQFGGYVPRLGDGRALLLGELHCGAGELRDLHLKGSGRTPFARGGDGLAAVGPMLREYLVSEAMHALGIPSTRSLAVVATGHPVQRETPLDGAVLARIGSSHLRVGTFQYAAAGGDEGLLRRLADHAIARHYPAAAAATNPYLALFDAVVTAQAALLAGWMSVGFVHGVMNTDNTTISGETIDYGPCAFMDSYDPATVFSSIDQWGRYAYGNQPSIAGWNLARFAEALLPLFDDHEEQAVTVAQQALDRFPQQYAAAWSARIRAKLGLTSATAEEAPIPLISDLLGLLEQGHVDFTSFFRRLAAAARGDTGPVRDMVADTPGFDDWLRLWRALRPDADAMDRINPVYIPRNHLVEEALAAASAGDLAPFEDLLTAVSAPFQERAGFQRYSEPAPAEFGAYQTFCGT